MSNKLIKACVLIGRPLEDKPEQELSIETIMGNIKFLASLQRLSSCLTWRKFPSKTHTSTLLHLTESISVSSYTLASHPFFSSAPFITNLLPSIIPAGKCLAECLGTHPQGAEHTHPPYSSSHIHFKIK